MRLTKVAKGIAYGDVANAAIRNILTEIGNSIFGKFTPQDLRETLDFFDWKCPYTGRDLRKSLEDEDGSCDTDHICPQNKEGCGLNVKGNLVIVDKVANNEKKGTDVDVFLLTNTTVLGNLDSKTRQKRLEKIKDFQKLCGYDPETIHRIVKPILEARYAEIIKEQKECIEKTLDELKKEGIHPLKKDSSKKTGKKVQSQTTPNARGESKGTLANTDLRRILSEERITHADLQAFLSKAESKKLFGLNYPLLTENRETAKGRYYKEPVRIFKKDYYICNDWYELSRNKLVQWLEDHK